MVGNPHRYRAVLQQLENRHATAGLLLALVLLLPLAVRTANITLLMTSSLVYVLLIVPIAAGYFTLGSVIRALRLDKMYFSQVARTTWLLILWLHELYCSLRHTHTTVTQILFFLVAEKALCPDQRFVSLYALLFCTMLAYLYHSLQSRHWTQLMFTTTTADFLRLTSAFIIVRLGKGVAMSFILISITLQFDHLEPSLSFILIAGAYFILTELLKTPAKTNLIVQLVQELDLYILEGMEELWVPLFMNIATVLLTLVNVAIAVYNNIANSPLCVIILYSNVVVVLELVYDEFILQLIQQYRLLDKYSFPKKDQVRDTVCAICLDDMQILTARVTPCRHIFHSRCLRRCIQQYQQCPLCKQPISD